MQVPLGILLKNENKGSDMVEILTHLHQYVPVKEYTKQVFIPSINEELKFFLGFLTTFDLLIRFRS